MARKILIVDDDKNICELLRLYLEKEGYQTAIALNGRSAVEQFHSFAPDLVLLDVMLPGKDGKAIATAMAADEELQGASIMIVSALEESEKMFTGNPQVKDFCLKPFRTAVLLEKVKKIMGDA